ncbi:hypothetical protein [Victivallis sp. Marseille-Q1083]|uniref:hypothetical protein n=1 Tax=Victivallis sp. Marseille-Q1083 TaxID=2717288 RepID=UPI001589E8C4|nr:hypothetical protein [Victivallis sp. Marseille-Q1083]
MLKAQKKSNNRQLWLNYGLKNARGGAFRIPARKGTNNNTMEIMALPFAKRPEIHFPVIEPLYHKKSQKASSSIKKFIKKNSNFSYISRKEKSAGNSDACKNRHPISAGRLRLTNRSAPP